MTREKTLQRTVSVAEINGTRLWCEDSGAGPPLVLMHGGPLDARMWDDQVGAFAARARVVRYDLRGYGRSAPPGAAPYRHEDDLAGLLGLLGIDRAAILGLSLGARLAVDFALAFPAAVSALVLADPSVSGFPWDHDVWAEADEIAATCRRSGLAAARRLMLERPVFATAREQPAVAHRLEQIIGDYSGWHWFHEDPVLEPRPPAYERLETIAAPTLVVAGERDLADYRSVAETLASRIPGARRETIPRVGHMSNMEAPEPFNRIVLDFLAELPISQTGIRPTAPTLSR